MILLKKRKKV